MAQLYKITNIKNNKQYYGLVEKVGKTFLNRFDEHMNGEGGVWIKRDLESGQSTVDDFKIELICEGSTKIIRQLEIDHIKENNTLYPNGYNGNCGHYIVVTKDMREHIDKVRQEKILAGEIDTKKLGSKNQGIYIYDNGDIRSLPINHPDILDGTVKHINYRGGDIKEQEHKNEKNRQREINGGYTDKQIAAFEGAGERVRKYTITHENWLDGRKKYSERMARKEFTEKELESYAKNSDMVQEFWNKQTDEYKLNRVQNGLDAMNSSMVCEYCGIETNKGNYGRWHGEKCKMKDNE